jgi:NAD(P)-dependent dehydrogenase (short-subunit alcohol dehydrogenase family)
MTGGMLQNKVVIVTGAGQGIGAAAALLMAREGARVVVAEISALTGQRTVDQITAAGGQAIFVPTDVSQEDQVARLVASAVATYGRLDCAFNNAGFGNPIKNTADLEAAEWDQVHNVVLRGTFLCMKYQIPALLAGGGGAIVNNASNAGLRAVPTQSAYSAAKAGVIGLSRTAAVEYAARGLRINVICPGLIRTPIILKFEQDGVDWSKTTNMPIGRAGEPSEVAEAALWLCSARSSYVTGQVLSVDGGSTAL